jgi:hypothetical protein
MNERLTELVEAFGDTTEILNVFQDAQKNLLDTLSQGKYVSSAEIDEMRQIFFKMDKASTLIRARVMDLIRVSKGALREINTQAKELYEKIKPDLEDQRCQSIMTATFSDMTWPMIRIDSNELRNFWGAGEVIKVVKEPYTGSMLSLLGGELANFCDYTIVRLIDLGAAIKDVLLSNTDCFGYLRQAMFESDNTLVEDWEEELGEIRKAIEQCDAYTHTALGFLLGYTKACLAIDAQHELFTVAARQYANAKMDN